MSVTSEFASFVSRMKYQDLPQDVKEKAKKQVLDLFGGILYSSKMPWSKKVVTLVKGYQSRGKSTVIPFGFRTSAPAAALANGTMGHGFELDDFHDAGMHHPGAVVIPALLAVGERDRINGRQFLLAMVMGYEAMCRVGMAVNAKVHNMKGFHPTGTNGPFGAATAVGKMIGLNRDRLIDALGIAGSFCCGLMEFSQESSDAGAMIKRLHAGKASESGVMAAFLAKDGFRGPSDIIGGKNGYCNVYSDQPQIHLMNDALGVRYEIMNVGTKPYPCCALIHPIIDTIRKIKDDHAFKADDIEEVNVGTAGNTCDHNVITQIDSIMAAQYSALFGVALAITGNSADPNNFTRKYAKRGDVKEIMGRTKFHKDDEMERVFPATVGAKVEIRLKSGKSLTGQVMQAKGRPQNPMSFEEVCNKFKTLSKDIIKGNKRDEIIEKVRGLEKVSDISELTKLLVRR